jgi:hypothetical protein
VKVGIRQVFVGSTVIYESISRIRWFCTSIRYKLIFIKDPTESSLFSSLKTPQNLVVSLHGNVCTHTDAYICKIAKTDEEISALIKPSSNASATTTA